MCFCVVVCKGVSVWCVCVRVYICIFACVVCVCVCKVCVWVSMLVSVCSMFGVHNFVSELRAFAALCYFLC